MVTPGFQEGPADAVLGWMQKSLAGIGHARIPSEADFPGNREHRQLGTQIDQIQKNWDEEQERLSTKLCDPICAIKPLHVHGDPRFPFLRPLYFVPASPKSNRSIA